MSERRVQSGFTLVELLVTIGIIAILASLLLVGLSRWRTQAENARVRMDFAAIAAAIEAYRMDMGDYPRNHAFVENPSNSYKFPSSCRLGDYLIGPAPRDDDVSNPPNSANIVEYGDGADGPGFRTLRSGGRVWGPYLPPDRFKVRRLSEQLGVRQWVILDRWDTPIEYYPLRRPAGPAGPHVATLLALPGVTGVIGPLLGDSDTYKTLFDDREGELSQLNDDGTPARSTADMRVQMNASWEVTSFPGPRKAMAVMLGDDNADNYIALKSPGTSGGESARWETPYVLISAGRDARFATDGWGAQTPITWLKDKSDDIYNFER